ncbi:hypothetical protein LWI28_025316 [Acer negundo]|uniref:FAR1 domain-containing protein n=1 Tax=Acer negundo TaxID=4023 RepID=A0AAD5J2I0_ACENE|nr:hypothetical protein LWI28_025316 [Acer negundo]
MGNGKEHPFMLTPCSSNPPSAEFNENRPNPQETKDCGSGTSQNVEIDDDDMIEEPKKGIEFNSLEDLLSYYKSYGKKCGFGVMTKRTERGEDQTVRYVTLACARGGKARNRTFNVGNPHPIGKTECEAKINALRSDEKLQLTTVHNIHSQDLSPKEIPLFSMETRGTPFCHVGADAAAETHRRLYIEDELGMKFTTTIENDEDENNGEDKIER